MTPWQANNGYEKWANTTALNLRLSKPNAHAESKPLTYSKYNENKAEGEKNPHKILGTILAKSFSVYINGVMETNWSEWSVAVLCFSDVFLWLRAEHITLQLNEISGLLLSFDSVAKCQIELALRNIWKYSLFFSIKTDVIYFFLIALF